MPGARCATFSSGTSRQPFGYVKKNFLAGLELLRLCRAGPCHSSLGGHGGRTAHPRHHPPPTTHQRPVDCFEGERDQLERLKPNGYDLGTIEKVRATSTCKVPLESNHYSVPPHLAGQADERARACPQDPRPGRAAWPPGGGAAFRHGLALQACSAEYIANILVARRPIGQEPTALQLPRSADLVELAWPEPDRSIFDRQRGTDQAHSK